jgi:hypothetical protein
MWGGEALRRALAYGYRTDETPLNAMRDQLCYGINGWGANHEFVKAPCGDCPAGLGAHVDDPACPWTWSSKISHIKMPADMIAVSDSNPGNAGLNPNDSKDSAWDEAIDPDPWGGAEWPGAPHRGTRQPPSTRGGGGWNPGVSPPLWTHGAEVLYVDGHVTYDTQYNLTSQKYWNLRRWNITHKEPL